MLMKLILDYSKKCDQSNSEMFATLRLADGDDHDDDEPVPQPRDVPLPQGDLLRVAKNCQNL